MPVPIFRSKIPASIVALTILFLSALTLPSTAAKPDQERESAFRDIISSVDRDDWAEALLLIDLFRSNYPRSDREALLTLLAAECNLNLRRLEQAVVLASQVLVQFPEPTLTGRARLVLGECALLTSNYDKAEFNLSWVVSFSDDQLAIQTARRRLEELHDFLEARQISERTPPISESPKTALILPMTGALSKESRDFLTGFRFAWMKFPFPDPILFDSDNDPVRAARLFDEVAKNHRAWIVVGGLTAADASCLAALSISLQVPFLTTSCGEDGLASISPFAIQGRPDFGGLGAALGEFATINLGLRRLAIFYVDNPGGRQTAKEFREAVTAGGGRIVGENSFYAGTIDYSNNLMQLKKSLVRANFDDSLNMQFVISGSLTIDGMQHVPSFSDLGVPDGSKTETQSSEGMWELSRRFLDSLWKQTELEANRWIVENSQDIDTALIELPYLDGLFAVIEPGTIEMISPQLARYRLTRQIFGNECWSDRDGLLKVQRYVNGIIFADPLGPVNDSAEAEFTAAVLTQGDKSVSRYHYAGERAASIVAEGLKRAHNREGLRDAIATANQVETLSGRITIVKEERVDRSRGLVLFKDGKFGSIGE